jgi:hypothetical protein
MKTSKTMEEAGKLRTEGETLIRQAEIIESKAGEYDVKVWVWQVKAHSEKEAIKIVESKIDCEEYCCTVQEANLI